MKAAKLCSDGGPVPSADKPAAFRARTDGGISLGVARPGLQAIIFEGKSTRRDSHAISVQQTMDVSIA